MGRQNGQVVAVRVQDGPGPVGPERREGERSEPDRSGGPPGPEAAAGAAAVPAAPVPDPQVERPARRTFTAEYKKRILEQVDRCRPGELGALLRREGLYSSHVTTWRAQRAAGTLAGLAPKKRGRKPVPKNPLAGEVARLQRELRRAVARAERAEGLVELQKKVAELFGRELPSEETLLAEAERTQPSDGPARRRRR
jgi:transposase